MIMGGNAIKNVITRRYQSQEYYELETEVHNMLGIAFPLSTFRTIPSYKNKQSFGDMDIVVTSVPYNWTDVIERLFSPKEMVKNGNCLSFEYKEFQIDLITCSGDEFYTALNYFSYNDLGNLLGRIARKLGFKYGHDGLSYDFREGTEQYRNVVLLTNIDEILILLGYSPERYHQGFDELVDIFEFVVSSPYFDKEIFGLENRNHAARVRDAKRKTYTDFLIWLETYDQPSPLKIGNNDLLAWQFENVPHFVNIYQEVMANWAQDKLFKTLYNGEIVSKATSLTGKELGEFMKWLNFIHGNRLRTIILSMKPTLIDDWIFYYFVKFKSS